MSDQQPDPDLSARFNLDQAEADAETQTRDQVTWDLNVKTANADTATKLAYAAHLRAKAEFWSALGFLVGTMGAIVLVVALVLGVQEVVGWFQ